MRILLVEDSVVLRDSLAQGLREAGYAVDAVVEGAGLPRPRRSLPDGLTEREAEVLVLVARGLTNKEIAVRLGVSPVTVKNHVFHLYGKCGVQTRAAAALYAVRNALVE